jgi:hypothetical protein
MKCLNKIRWGVVVVSPLIEWFLLVAIFWFDVYVSFSPLTGWNGWNIDNRMIYWIGIILLLFIPIVSIVNLLILLNKYGWKRNLLPLLMTLHYLLIPCLIVSITAHPGNIAPWAGVFFLKYTFHFAAVIWVLCFFIYLYQHQKTFWSNKSASGGLQKPDAELGGRCQ